MGVIRKDPKIRTTVFASQVKLPDVGVFLLLLKNAESSVAQDFETVKADLTAEHTEAKDNVRFLSTLERHFKNLSQAGGYTILYYYIKIYFGQKET